MKLALASFFNNGFKQPANKQARTQDEHNRAKTLSKVIAITIKHNWQAIVSSNNGSEPISSVILPKTSMV